MANPPASLTIGSRAPKLAVKEFVIGEPVKELRAGTIHVVEFSGTRCVPCIKCIPLLTELQNKHKSIVVISIYSEGRKDVGDCLTKHKEKIGFRVAVDPEGVMWRTWVEAASREGLPQAFIVDAKGLVVWIGDPADLAEPLAQVVAGTYDPRVAQARVRLEQGVVQQQQRTAEREEKAMTVYERIRVQINEEKLADALTACDAAIKEYADTAEALDYLRLAKVRVLAKQPDKKDAAFEYALDWAVAVGSGADPARCVQVANFLLVPADELADQKARDARLTELAVVLLGRADAALRALSRDRTKRFVETTRIEIRTVRGRAFHLQGDQTAAVRSIDDAITILKTLQPEKSDDKGFPAWRDSYLTELTAARSRYAKVAGQSPKDR